MSDLKAILKQYQENTTKPSKRMTSEERLKQYFTTFLKPGINSATKKIRILPMKNGESPFAQIKIHSAQVNGQWRKFTCPQHEAGEDCPFCEARNALLATGDDADKELAKNYSARLTYVVKVIDREHEDEGPKFWRFGHSYAKTGILDKLMGVLNGISDSENNTLTDAQTGRDLTITIARNQMGIPTVNAISQGDAKPLHSDSETSENWLNDDRIWSDVYSIKPYSYLEIIVKGGEPMWKKNTSGDGGEWVDKNAVEEVVDDSADELTMDSETSITESTEASTEASTESTEGSSKTTDEVGDDLPF